MSPFLVSCLWCVLQVSLLCAVGVALSLLVARRYAASSAAVMSTTAGVILVATVLAPIQIPHWNLPQVQVTETVTAPAVLSGEDTSSESTLQTEKPGAVLVDLYAMLSRVRSAVHRDAVKISSPNPTVWCVATVVVLGIAVGLLRLCGAFFSVWQIRRGSVLMQGELADNELKALAQTMDCRLSVRVATSAAVESAAVIGWLRPLVVLPKDWRTWPLEQLRAVLAHELAHIVRRDYLWRAVGTIARAVHFYHPLAHWLLGRLTVSQEVAADQLAAQTLGSRSKYLKALSHLALRQDDQLHREPILMPTSSSHLMRRIKMLRTKERTQSRSLDFIIRAVAVSMIVLLAVATIVLRGLAEPAEISTPILITQAKHVPNSTEEMFKYPPIDPAIIGDNEHGIFVLRVGEILKQESIKPMIGMINQMVSSACKSVLGLPESVEIDLALINYVVGQTQFELRRENRTPENEHPNRIKFGSNYWIVRFNCDISAWKEWIRTNAPEAEELQHDEITYFQFPPIPAIGPKGIRVAARDSHTLVFSPDGDLFWEQVEATNTVRARWADEWKELDGGLFAFLATDKSIEASFEEPNSPSALAVDQVFDNIQQMGLGVDWNEQTNQMSIKYHLYCEGQAEADIVLSGIESLVSLKTVELEAKIEEQETDGQADSPSILFRSIDSLRSLETQTTTSPNGTVVVKVNLSDPFPLDEILRQIVPGEVASRESAEGKLK